MRNRLEEAVSGLVPPHKLQEYRDKIDEAMVLLLQGRTFKGGNPFVWMFAVSKPHLVVTKLAGAPDHWDTCATDGARYYWHPSFLDLLSPISIALVMCHETYHIILQHGSVERHGGRLIAPWRAAVDYVVNAMVMKQLTPRGMGLWHQLAQESQMSYIPLQRLLDTLDGTCLDPIPPAFGWADEDPSIQELTTDHIYDEIVRRLKPGDAGMDMLQEASGDAHLPPALNPQQLMQQIMQAAAAAEVMGIGNVPGQVEEMLGKLKNPTLDLSGVVRSATMRKAARDGSFNNWKRLKRRELSYGVIAPTKYTHQPRWLAMIDTSTSMSNQEMTLHVSQLETLARVGPGFVVPCDTMPRWADTVHVSDVSRLENMRVTGRGGTAFDDFFAQLPSRMGVNWDIIVVMTDGGVNPVPRRLAPPCDVVWVVTHKSAGFVPEFGRVLHLKD